MYKIAEWNPRYEVNVRGEPYKPDDKARLRPLEFVRWKVNGRKQGSGYRRLLAQAGDRSMEVLGVFGKLLELAADQPRYKRDGTIYNDKDLPATIEDISFDIGAPVDQIENALTILCARGWVVKEESEEIGNQQESPQIVRTITDESGILRNLPLPYITEPNRNRTELNLTETKGNGKVPVADSEDLPVVQVPISQSFSESARFGFVNNLIKILHKESGGSRSKGDTTLYRNLCNSLDRDMRDRKCGMEILDTILAIARECKTGRSPPALFQTKLREAGIYYSKVHKMKK